MDEASCKAVLLTNDEMARADAAAIAGGTPGRDLMERAGSGVARAALASFPHASRWLVLCGPGNNGGDGFVIARHLKAAGRAVDVACLVDPAALKGDAAWARSTWDGPVGGFDAVAAEGHEAIVDAVFGAGLARSLEGIARTVLERAAGTGCPIVAVDVPSGVDGSSGAVLGYAPRAELTVTFFRKKPAHCLYPARGMMGHVQVVDIGIPDSVLEAIGPRTFENSTELWRADWPALEASGHKYHRGHAGIVSGGMARTGAARLGARAALRAGAGLVSVLSPKDALAENAAHLTAVMVKPVDDVSISAVIADARINTVLAGPGLGTGHEQARMLERVAGAAARGRCLLVLDADALTIMSVSREAWRTRLPTDTVMTPHEGEFGRLFPHLDARTTAASRLERARAAAALSGAIVVLKGADTVISAPDGRAAINTNAPPTLATAGSGDVLAGIIAGLLARGMDAFDAACAGVFLHGAAAQAFGPGLIAEDLPEMLPKVFASLDLC
ncbi:MAG: NAD(P)H-hydrate dehydratase [Rhodobiaceae bacterium]|nr:NAD(P)H-hydrate dehydratase [Rhodobiaceae bacterium]MCC0041352.1 NAD(P)H-hydrate dehydratase [Rhodobiaceae bacterium]